MGKAKKKRRYVDYGVKHYIDSRIPIRDELYAGEEILLRKKRPYTKSEDDSDQVILDAIIEALYDNFALISYMTLSGTRLKEGWNYMDINGITWT